MIKMTKMINISKMIKKINIFKIYKNRQNDQNGQNPQKFSHWEDEKMRWSKRWWNLLRCKTISRSGEWCFRSDVWCSWNRFGFGFFSLFFSVWRIATRVAFHITLGFVWRMTSVTAVESIVRMMGSISRLPPAPITIRSTFNFIPFLISKYFILFSNILFYLKRFHSIQKI